jgi:anti-anti-sigma regulatory factor
VDEPTKAALLVNAYTDPVLVRVEGRASFLNAGALRDCFTELGREGKTRFALDFAGCTSMDSTFLGVLAGTALALRRLDPPGGLTLVRLGARNLELVRNLGLHRLATVDAEGARLAFDGGPSVALPADRRPEIERARLVLEAHEKLVEADAANAPKFQDVLAFLRARVDGR